MRLNSARQRVNVTKMTKRKKNITKRRIDVNGEVDQSKIDQEFNLCSSYNESIQYFGHHTDPPKAKC